VADLEAAVTMADAAWQKHAAGRSTPNGGASEHDGALTVKFWDELGQVVPPDRLVRNLLGTTSLALIYGEPGSGKTFLVTDLGMHIALGRDWFGRRVTAGAVLYVACEGMAGLSNRLAAFRLTNDPPGGVPFAVVPSAVDLGPDGQDADRIIHAAQQVKTKAGQDILLIVIDTLARAMVGGDENSAKDMSSFVKACDRVRVETGATVLIVHHSGKAKQSGARGSSALLGAVDTAIEVEKSTNGVRTAKVIKQKDSADGLELNFTLRRVEVGRDEDGESITSCVVEATDVAPELPDTTLAAQGLKVLHAALKESGEAAPAGLKASADAVVTVEQFQAALKEAGVTSCCKPATARKRWERIKETLCDKGLLIVEDEYCWMPRRR
jgi:hypothetical protein